MAVKPLSLKQNILWNSIGCTIYQGCVWIITFLVVILSDGYSDSGALAFAMAIGNIFFPLATYNMRTFQVSDLKGEFSSGNYVGFRIITIALSLVIILIYALVSSSSLALFLTVVCWLVFKTDECFCNVLYSVDQRYERMDYIGISQGLRGVLLVAGFSAGMVLTSSIYFSIILMSIVCIIVTFAYDLSHAQRCDSIRPTIDKATALQMFKKCLPAVCTLVCYGAVVSVSRQLFEASYGTEALGIYAAVATPTAIVQVAAQYLYSPVLVRLGECWTNGDYHALASTAAKTYGYIIGIGIAAVIVAWLIGDPVLRWIYGESITPHTYLLTYALIATAFSAVMGFSLDFLIVIRKLGGALVSNALALAVCIATTKILCNMFYMNGVSITVIVSFSVGIILALVLIVKAIREAQNSISAEE